MKFFDRLLTRAALKSPTVERLLKSAGDAIRESRTIKDASRFESLMGQEIELQYSNLRLRMRDILDLRQAELACVNPKAATEIIEAWSAPPSSVAVFKERLWELELALEDRGWVREVMLSTLEFSRYGVQQLIRICRIYGIKNPLIKRGAEICAMYVFGRGIEIRSEDDTANGVIQNFLQVNQAEIGHVGLTEKEKSIQTDGSLYFALKATPNGVRVQMIEPLEIMDVITEPDNRACPQFFYRQWQQFDNPIEGPQNTPMKCWYPSVDYMLDPTKEGQRPPTVQAVTVNWDMPILRVKIGCPPNWLWGIPPIYASIDWARAYKDFLEDWATVQRTLARFALVIETKGGPGAIAAYNALLNTTFADSGGTRIERNPPPNVGSAHISGPGNQIRPFKSGNSQTAPEQARRLLLMVAAAHGMPETFYGDASTGSLATAVSLDRPTELKFKEIQQRWVYTLKTILRYVLYVEARTAGSKMREARANDPAPQPIEIIVKFPAVLEHAIKDMVESWTHALTCGGRNGIPAGILDRRTAVDGMLEELGVENRTALLDDIYGEVGEGPGQYDPGDDVEDQRTQVAAQNLSQPAAPNADALGDTGKAQKPGGTLGTKPTKEALLEARKDLNRAMAKLARNGR
jgi:hypothetical protein